MRCYNCNSEKIVYNKEKDAFICLNCKHEFLKQYFFISHSHLDIEKVRIIRNIVEETFFYEPILFFLKCLSEEKEISELVQRELKERIWFIYCKSKNAEESKYVLEERKYIDDLIKNGYYKKILTVELDRFEISDDRCYKDLRDQISYQIRKTKIFLSCSSKDYELAKILRDRLTAKGYSVFWSAVDWSIGEDAFSKAVDEVVKHSYKDGIFMPVFTENSFSSTFMKREVELAFMQHATFFPVVADGNFPDNFFGNDSKLSFLSFELAHLICCELDRNHLDRSINRLLELLDQV